MSWRPPPHIRAVAIAVVRRGDEILVYRGRNPTTGETFYRPLGGGIDFGEPGEAALAREFREEVGAELGEVRYLDTFENIYVYDGHQGHELVRVYDARLTDASLYTRDSWTTVDHESGMSIEILWKRVVEFETDRLYPDGLLELLRAASA